MSPILEKRFKPWKVISLYRDEKTNTIYPEIATYRKDMLNEFSPLSSQMSRAIGKLLYKSFEKHLGGAIPSNLVYYNPTPLELQWRCEIQKATLHYVKDLGIENGERPIPNLLFTFKNDELCVKAYKEWKGDKTIYYHAPFHNVYADTRICMGRAKLKPVASDRFETILNRLQVLFFIVPGSEIHYEQGFNLNTFHKELLHLKKFPYHKLKVLK